VTVIILWAPLLPLGSSAAALRLLRLLRLAKLVEKIPKLRALIAGLVGGMKEIGYISIMILLIFYLIAILGIEVFRENDPWHFRDFFLAMETLFRMATPEDWTNVLYVNFYGCDTFTDTGLYILPNATCAIVQDCDKYLAAPGDSPTRSSRPRRASPTLRARASRPTCCRAYAYAYA
jgi:voltage-gated sodium channel